MVKSFVDVAIISVSYRRIFQLILMMIDDNHNDDDNN